MKPFKPPVPTERQVQREILRMCGEVFPSIYIAHVPNGAHLAGGDAARFKQMGALRGDGLKPGFPDLIVLWNYGVGFLEVKRPKSGKVSEVQEATHVKLTELGHRVAVVYSAYEAQCVLLEWGAPASCTRWPA